jgi:hypothetical protein
MLGDWKGSFYCNIVTLSIGLEVFLHQRWAGSRMRGNIGGDGRSKEKGQGVCRSVLLSSASHDAVVLVGKSSQFFSWKSARKDARTSEKPQLCFYNSIFVPGFV